MLGSDDGVVGGEAGAGGDGRRGGDDDGRGRAQCGLSHEQKRATGGSDPILSPLRRLDAVAVSTQARIESRNREVHLPPISTYRWWARRTRRSTARSSKQPPGPAQPDDGRRCVRRRWRHPPCPPRAVTRSMRKTLIPGPRPVLSACWACRRQLNWRRHRPPWLNGSTPASTLRMARLSPMAPVGSCHIPSGWRPASAPRVASEAGCSPTHSSVCSRAGSGACRTPSSPAPMVTCSGGFARQRPGARTAAP